MYNLRRESERRTTLPPDEAVLPLIVRGGGTLARTIVQPSSRPNRSQTGSDSDYKPTDASSTTGSERGSVAMAEELDTEFDASGTATSKYIKLFSDLLIHVLVIALDITDDHGMLPGLFLPSCPGTPDIYDDHGTQPGSSLFSRSDTPDINDGNRGGLPCFVAAESLTGAITCPPPTSDAFQGLLIVANEMGFMYGSPEREGRVSLFNDTAQRPITLPITPTSHTVMSLPFNQPEVSSTPLFFTLPPADNWSDAALLVSVCLKCGSYKHSVLRTPLPKSVLGTYGCLVQSTEAAVSSITSLLRTLDGHEVWLATSRKPILMDGKKYHESPMAGYIELGCLTALDLSVEFRPAVDCDERRQLMEMQDITVGTPIYILYIWSSESERASPVLWGPSALGNSNVDVAAQVDVAALLMEEQYMALFNELIIDAPTAQSTFTMIIFVRIVMEPKTFLNHRGWVFWAETLHETLLKTYPCHSQMSNRLTKERTMIDWLGDLLQTPLSEARHLRPFVYGSMSEFHKKLDTLERQNNLRGVRQKTGEGSCSVRGGKRGSPEESGDESGD
ncbi:hypothetical protein JOM56_013796 [Amanita muscaria]